MKLKLLFRLLLPLILISACAPDPNEPQHQQPNPAAHNALMQTSRVFEGSGEAFYLRFSSPSGDGNIYYYGYDRSGQIDVYDVIVNGEEPTTATSTLGNEYEIGKLTPTGNKLWAKYSEYRPRDILGLTKSTGLAANGLLTAGDQLQEDGVWRGIISLYSNEQGDTLSSIVLPGSASWINSLASLNDSPNSFVGYGGTRIDDRIYPLICEIDIDEEGKIFILKQNYFLSLSNHYFTSGSNSNSSNEYCGILTDEAAFEVSIVNINNDFSIDWEKTLEYDGLIPYIGLGNNILMEGARIYVIFYTSDANKSNEDGTVFHNSGVVQCFSLQGELVWEQILRPSDYSDRLRELILVDNFLYVVGEHSGVCWRDDEECYVNGWLSKVDRYNGQVIADYTFSGHTTNYQYSRFWSITHVNNSLHLLGTTNINEFQTPNTYDGWFVTVNLDDL